MSKVLRFPDIERIEEQACDWIARLDSGNITAAESLKLQQWLADDEIHQHTLLEMAELLDKMTVVSVLSKLLPLAEIEMVTPAPHLQSRAFIRSWPGIKPLTFAIAACAAVFAVWIQLPPGDSAADYRTAVGEVKTYELTDTSLITLNTNSHLVTDFSRDRRRIILSQGEAMFEVAHDPSRPFVVEVNGNQITATGTAFNVEFSPTKIEVTVTEGTVEIRSLRSLAEAATDSFGAEVTTQDPVKPRAMPRRVQAGQAAILNKSSMDVRAIDTEIVDTKLSWREGKLVFQGEPLEYVIAEAGRYSMRKLIITDDRIRAVPVGGVFKTGDIENLLDFLEHGFDIRVTKTAAGDIYLSGNE